MDIISYCIRVSIKIKLRENPPDFFSFIGITLFESHAGFSCTSHVAEGM